MIKKTGNIKFGIEIIKNKKNAAAVIFHDASFGEGPLKNLTFTIKNNYATKDSETNASSKILEGFMPSYNATVVEKLKKAGAAMLAKVHLDELALGGTGTHSSFGIITNPLDETRIVGGSSSGSAATLEGVSISIGSDTGDSVRNPASYVGKIGFKPSYGAISRYGLFAFATSLDTVGYLAHNVNDVIEVSDILYGIDYKDMSSREIIKPINEMVKPKKIGIIKNLINSYDEEYKIKFYDFIDKLKNDGIEVIETEIDLKLLESIGAIYEIISYSEASSNLANLNGVAFGKRSIGDNWEEIMTKTRSDNFGSMLQRRITLGAFFLAIENQKELFEKAQKIRRLIVEAFTKVYEEVDFIVSIATPIAPKIEHGKENKIFNDFLIHSNFEGSPSITLPCFEKDNMPFGIVIDAAQDKDKELLSSALYIENFIGGNNE